jgi:hypothetical protein
MGEIRVVHTVVHMGPFIHHLMSQLAQVFLYGVLQRRTGVITANDDV